MNTFLFTLTFLFFCSVSYSGAQDSLKKYQWKNRVILLFLDSRSNDDLEKQQKILESDSSGVKERDLVILTIDPESSSELRDLRQSYNVDNSFTFVLIGKDGGEKKRSHSPVKLQELFSLIDSMPMRQSEIRRKNQ